VIVTSKASKSKYLHLQLQILQQRTLLELLHALQRAERAALALQRPV
jgi:hypothetical protein